ncbi:MAG TPA: protein kinase [Kofleriaceae bacterium]|nr:protein kinase [Kofleriaceae bacterium]
MLGRYELVATIGEGGMARVILARQRGPAGFEKVVVIKVIHPRMSDDRSAIGMLLDEARVAAQISHQHVVQTYELGEVEGTFYIVMEYLAGESLHRVLKTAAIGPALDPRMAARIIASAADGLHAAHEQCDLYGRNLGVVHRDVSPGNIVVLYNGGVKVVDFGIAKTQDRVSNTTQHGQLKGKYAYMSPEQIRNEPLDRRSDVFSLGVVLWEALALRRLFHAETIPGTLMQILSTERVPPSMYRPEIPQALDAITLKALAPDPRDRFQTAAEMKRALEDAIWESRCDSSDIHAWMTAVFGDRIRKRQALLTSATRESIPRQDLEPLALEDTSWGHGPSYGSAHTPAPPRRPASRMAVKVLAVSAAVAVLAAVGVGVMMHVRKSDAGVQRVALGDPAPAPTPVPEVTPIPTPPPGATATPKPTVEPITPVQPTTVADSAPRSRLRPEHLEPTRAVVEEVAQETPTREPSTPQPPRSNPPKQKPAGSLKELYTKGTELYLSGNFVESAKVFKEALAIDKNYAPAHRGLGFVYHRSGMTGKAIEHLKRYLALAPDASDADTIRDRIAQLGGDN